MRLRVVAAVIFSLGAAIFGMRAWVHAHQRRDFARPETRAQYETILVAAYPLPAGTVLTRDRLASVRMPAWRVPPDTARDLPVTRTILRHSVLRVALAAGAPIRRPELLRRPEALPIRTAAWVASVVSARDAITPTGLANLGGAFVGLYVLGGGRMTTYFYDGLDFRGHPGAGPPLWGGGGEAFAAAPWGLAGLAEAGPYSLIGRMLGDLATPLPAAAAFTPPAAAFATGLNPQPGVLLANQPGAPAYGDAGGAGGAVGNAPVAGGAAADGGGVPMALQQVAVPGIAAGGLAPTAAIRTAAPLSTTAGTLTGTSSTPTGTSGSGGATGSSSSGSPPGGSSSSASPGGGGGGTAAEVSEPSSLLLLAAALLDLTLLCLVRRRRRLAEAKPGPAREPAVPLAERTAPVQAAALRSAISRVFRLSPDAARMRCSSARIRSWRAASIRRHWPSGATSRAATCGFAASSARMVSARNAYPAPEAA